MYRTRGRSSFSRPKAPCTLVFILDFIFFAALRATSTGTARASTSASESAPSESLSLMMSSPRTSRLPPEPPLPGVPAERLGVAAFFAFFASPLAGASAAARLGIVPSGR